MRRTNLLVLLLRLHHWGLLLILAVELALLRGSLLGWGLLLGSLFFAIVGLVCGATLGGRCSATTAASSPELVLQTAVLDRSVKNLVYDRIPH